MAETFKRLDQRQMSASATTYYTCPGATAAIIKHIRIVNISGGGVTAKLWQGGTADGNVILPATSIDAGGWAEFDGALTLAAADTIAGIAGAATSLTITIEGVEIT